MVTLVASDCDEVSLQWTLVSQPISKYYGYGPRKIKGLLTVQDCCLRWPRGVIQSRNAKLPKTKIDTRWRQSVWLEAFSLYPILHFSHFDLVHFRLSVEKGHVPGVHTIPTGNTQNSYIYLFAKIGENKDMREIIFQETTFSWFSRLDNPPSFTRLTHSGVDAVRNKSARTRASAMLE